MKKKIIGFAALLILSLMLSVPLVLAQPHGPPAHIDEPEAVIYVTSQGKCYHTIVPYAGDTLPYNGHNGGSFQELDTTTTPASTDFGPGDPGYRGGRWWVDQNDDDVMDPEGTDHYFLCPLLGPGQECP